MSSSLCKRLPPSDYIGNRPSNRIANWLRIFAQLWIGAVHVLVMSRVASYSRLRAASPLGNAPFGFTTLRTCRLYPSTVLVV